MSAIILPNKPLPLSSAQEDCVEKLREALAEAELGKVSALALVLCMKGGYAKVIGGVNAAELNLGLDSLKADILREVEGAHDMGPLKS